MVRIDITHVDICTVKYRGESICKKICTVVYRRKAIAPRISCKAKKVNHFSFLLRRMNAFVQAASKPKAYLAGKLPKNLAERGKMYTQLILGA